MQKVVFIDWNFFVHRSLFSCSRQGNLDLAPFQCIRGILACLKLIKLTEDDLIIFAVDSPLGSWRKSVDPNYKSNRDAIKKLANIDWDFWYIKFNALLTHLIDCTPFHKVECERLEADDIISVGTRFYKDREVIIVSRDSDFFQLELYQNIKILNPITKKFQIVNNPHKVLSQKIRSERTDNLKVAPKTAEEYQKRNLIVNLLSLPEYIENMVVKSFHMMNIHKCYNCYGFKFDRLVPDLKNLFRQEGKKILTYNDSFKKKRKTKNIPVASIY